MSSNIRGFLQLLNCVADHHCINHFSKPVWWVGGCAGVNFSVCALGDRSYEHYCACGKAVDLRLEKLGAQRFVERAEVNREDWPTVDGWLANVAAALENLPLKPASETGA